MNRRNVDIGALLLVTLILAGGFYTAWQAARQRRAIDGVMGWMMGGAGRGAVDPFWYVLGTVALAVFVAGVYVTVRDDLGAGHRRPPPDATAPSHDQGLVSPERQSTHKSPGKVPADVELSTGPRPGVLDVLPATERRLLAPVIDSPGLTQIELRDRSEFSKSTVSQVVTDLEKRGLLYRERQGRTYRVYPDESIIRD